MRILVAPAQLSPGIPGVKRQPMGIGWRQNGHDICDVGRHERDHI